MPSECEDDDANNDEVNEPDDTEIFFDPDTPKDDVEVEESLFFDCKQWEPGVMPVQPSMGFLGKTGPQHSLSPDSLPYQFFCLFIPVYIGGPSGQDIQTQRLI